MLFVGVTMTTKITDTTSHGTQPYWSSCYCYWTVRRLYDYEGFSYNR